VITLPSRPIHVAREQASAEGDLATIMSMARRTNEIVVRADINDS
jgi:hypothetical protein